MEKKNKKLKGIALCLAFALTVSAAGTAPKAEAKIMKKQADITKVQKKLTGVKDKKYCYYLSYRGLSDRKLVRTNGKKTQTLKKDVKSFWISGKYIYYMVRNSIYRMKKNGTGKKKIAQYVMRILKVQDGYIYFKSTRAYKLSRAACDGSGQKFLLSYEKSGTAKIISDRIYYITKETVQTVENSAEDAVQSSSDDTDTEMIQRTVYSMSLDGTDVEKEYEAPAGMNLQIASINDRLVIFDEKEAHIRQDDGTTYITIKTSDLAVENALITQMGKNLLYIQYAENSNVEYGMYYISEAKYYMYDENLSKKLILDIAESGAVIGGEEYSLTKHKQYYILASWYDQSDDGLYIFNKKGKFIRKIDTSKVGEDNGYSCVIKNNKLYAAIYNDEKGRYDFEIYKLK
jgi:hypothetical protein